MMGNLPDKLVGSPEAIQLQHGLRLLFVLLLLQGQKLGLSLHSQMKKLAFAMRAWLTHAHVDMHALCMCPNAYLYTHSQALAAQPCSSPSCMSAHVSAPLSTPHFCAYICIYEPSSSCIFNCASALTHWSACTFTSASSRACLWARTSAFAFTSLDSRSWTFASASSRPC